MITEDNLQHTQTKINNIFNKYCKEDMQIIATKNSTSKILILLAFKHNNITNNLDNVSNQIYRLIDRFHNRILIPISNKLFKILNLKVYIMS